MKLGRKLLCAAVAATSMAGLVPEPARAAKTYRYRAPSYQLSASRTAFLLAPNSCNASTFSSSPAYELDGAIIDVSAFAGKRVSVAWTAEATIATSGGGFDVMFITGACVGGTQIFVNSGAGSLGTAGRFNLTIPAGTKWAALSSFSFANVALTATLL